MDQIWVWLYRGHRWAVWVPVHDPLNFHFSHEMEQLDIFYLLYGTMIINYNPCSANNYVNINNITMINISCQLSCIQGRGEGLGGQVRILF